MRKSILLVLLLAAMLISGCLPQTQAVTTTKSATVVANTPAKATATISSAASTSVVQSSPTAVATIPASTAVYQSSDCTVVTKQPTAGPTAESIYPPVTSADWVKGPADAKVTIIEYSDFQ